MTDQSLAGVEAPSDMPASTPACHASVSFTVIGDAAAQGSKKAFINPNTGRAILTEAGGVRLKAWRGAVADAATEYTELPPMDGPLWLVVTFRFPMPVSRPRARRLAGIGFKTTAPDLDKLIRSTGDALTSSGLVRDDARFARIHATKLEVLDGWIGAEISIHQLDAT